jgi:hypothetical protein
MQVRQSMHFSFVGDEGLGGLGVALHTIPSQNTLERQATVQKVEPDLCRLRALRKCSRHPGLRPPHFSLRTLQLDPP